MLVICYLIVICVLPMLLSIEEKKNDFVRLWDDPPCIIFVLHYFQFNGHFTLCVHIFSNFCRYGHNFLVCTWNPRIKSKIVVVPVLCVDTLEQSVSQCGKLVVPCGLSRCLPATCMSLGM